MGLKVGQKYRHDTWKNAYFIAEILNVYSGAGYADIVIVQSVNCGLALGEIYYRQSDLLSSYYYLEGQDKP